MKRALCCHFGNFGYKLILIGYKLPNFNTMLSSFRMTVVVINKKANCKIKRISTKGNGNCDSCYILKASFTSKLVVDRY